MVNKIKTKILFVIDSLHCAGAEKSITTLLNLIDYTRFEVDLQLFGYGGALEKILPQSVNLLPPLEYSRFANLNIKRAILKAIINFKWSMLKTRLEFSYKVRKRNSSNSEKARIFWQCCSKSIKSSQIKYDIAVSYAQGIPTFYVADKINAEKKYCWVNAIYTLVEKERKFQKQYYEHYDKIVGVSESAQKAFLRNYPEMTNKVTVIYDIIDYNTVIKMANNVESFSDDFDGIRILTIGRLSYQKGYDIAINACKILKENGIKFRWYVLGDGYQFNDINKWIEEQDLKEVFILLGIKENPYPYIKDCDIYVQTSKFEGFGLAISEARMLNKPIVATCFEAVYAQMINEKNGLVVDMNGQAVCDGILRLINDKELRESIVEYLQQEKKGNTEELEKFYELIETT